MTAAPPAGNQSNGTGPNVTDNTQREQVVKVAFENAWQELPKYESMGTVNLTGLTIHQIHGTGVAISGTADNWIVGAQQEDKSSLLVYDRESWSQITWGEAFTQNTITFDNILLPTQIYMANQKNIEEIMNANGVQESDMDLSDGMYIISIRSSTGLSMIRFNASTGELLS